MFDFTDFFYSKALFQESKVYISALAILFTVLIIKHALNLTGAPNSRAIPCASPSYPLLGNALHYKDHPDKYLLEQSAALGSVFKLNLAGMETVIVSSSNTLKQFAFTPENVLSSIKAVYDFGFNYSLGDINVIVGPSLHKKIIKNKVFNAEQIASLRNCMKDTMTEMLKYEVLRGYVQSFDFMMLTRRVILGTVIHEFFGCKFLDIYGMLHGGDILTDFMTFQDQVEETTAQSAVLPQFLALPLYLWPCQKQFHRLRENITSTVEYIWKHFDSTSEPGAYSDASESNNEVGIWLRVLKTMKKDQQFDCVDSSTETYTTQEVAELCCGLMFSAHKNAAIAAAQVVVFWCEKDRSMKKSQLSSIDINSRECKSCLEKAYVDIVNSTDDSNAVTKFIDNSIYETLRLTAHTIGAVRKVVDPSGWKVTGDDGIEYTVPYGMYVGASHIIPHKNKIYESYWNKTHEKETNYDVNLSVFDPDRPDLIEKCRDDLFFTTFSHGVHKCPGSHIAILLIKTYISALLLNFDININENSRTEIPRLNFERATLAQRKGKCILELQLR